jgi:hypothetical protein
MLSQMMALSFFPGFSAAVLFSAGGSFELNGISGFFIKKRLISVARALQYLRHLKTEHTGMRYM